MSFEIYSLAQPVYKRAHHSKTLSKVLISPQKETKQHSQKQPIKKDSFGTFNILKRPVCVNFPGASWGPRSYVHAC